MVKKSFIFLALFFSISLMALQTSIIQKLILDFIIHKTVDNPNISTSYGEIKGFFPFNFTIKKFNLNDQSKKIIDLENLSIAFNLQKEFFYIKKINCEKITLYQNITNLFKRLDVNQSPITINKQNIFPWTGSITYSTLPQQTDQLIIEQKYTSQKENGFHSTFRVQIKRQQLHHKTIEYTIHFKDSDLFFSENPLNLYASFTRNSKGLITLSKSSLFSKFLSLELNGQYMTKGEFFDLQFKSSYNLDKSKKIISIGSFKKEKQKNVISLNTTANYNSFDKNHKIIVSKTFDFNSLFSINFKTKELSIYSLKTKSPIPIEIASQEGIKITPEKIQGSISILTLTSALDYAVDGIYSSVSNILNLSIKSDLKNKNTFNFKTNIDLKKINAHGSVKFQTDMIPLNDLSFRLIESTPTQSLSIEIKANHLDVGVIPLVDFYTLLHFNHDNSFDINASSKIKNKASAPLSLTLSGMLESEDIIIKNLKISYLNQSITSIKSFRIHNYTTDPQINDLSLLLLHDNKDAGSVKWDARHDKITLHKISLLNFQNLFGSIPCSAEIDGFIDISSQLNFDNYALNIKKSSLTLSNFIVIDSLLQPYKFILQGKKVVFHLEENPESFKVQLLGYDHNKKHSLASGTISKHQTDIINAPINIQIKGDTDIHTIVDFLKVPDTIEGLLFYNLKYTGTLNNPNLNGTLQIKNGLYESFINGTYIAHLNGKISVKDNILNIHDIQGDDLRPGNKTNGIIHITGKSIIHRHDLIESHLVLKLTNMLVVKRDDMEMKASGIIKLDGENEKTKITGSVELNPATIWLEELTNDEITTIDLFKKGKRVLVSSEEINSKRIKTQKKNDQVLFPIDLELKVPNSLKLEGLGVSSLWSGNLYARGDFLIDVPYLMGSLSLVNGSMLFYSKKLKLTHGSILYDDKSLNNPYLKLVMMRPHAGQKLYITMQGRTTSGEEDSVNFTFSADPSETDKNVLSLIIFGKRTNQITAGQSVQLASIATNLSNKTNQNSGLMDNLKNSFGLDVFEFKENAREALYSDTGYTQKQVLSVGKDFNDFKVTFNQGIGDMDTKATISKPIGPHLNLDIDVGNQVAGSGGGLSWVYYY